MELEFDSQRRDKYGRLLAYVYLEDGTFLNAEQIKQGYATVFRKVLFKYRDAFKKHEREARENKRGVWRNKIRLFQKLAGFFEVFFFYRAVGCQRERFVLYELAGEFL